MVRRASKRRTRVVSRPSTSTPAQPRSTSTRGCRRARAQLQCRRRSPRHAARARAVQEASACPAFPGLRAVHAAVVPSAVAPCHRPRARPSCRRLQPPAPPPRAAKKPDTAVVGARPIRCSPRAMVLRPSRCSLPLLRSLAQPSPPLPNLHGGPRRRRVRADRQARAVQSPHGRWWHDSSPPTSRSTSHLPHARRSERCLRRLRALFTRWMGQDNVVDKAGRKSEHASAFTRKLWNLCTALLVALRTHASCGAVG